MIQTKKDILQLEAKINEVKRQGSYLIAADFNELIQENNEQGEVEDESVKQKVLQLEKERLKNKSE